eukprot:TRINITY_DN133849_c0_g1_i1.p1 TRINITY_DN133849_c0_g1~~TRINITY_DN133849_c0_g1_i1.p1  ORF type:complete len:151 (-),score=14.59 TRINITY_DN133849_c0_g1_i1:85-537(-)
MNGCSKRKSHRYLFPVLEFRQKSPALPHWIADRMSRKIGKKDTSEPADHPCANLLSAYMRCLRTFGSANHHHRLMRCAVSEKLYDECLVEHMDWGPKQAVYFVPVMEHYKTVGETHCFKYTLPSISHNGRRAVLKFAGNKNTTTNSNSKH